MISGYTEKNNGINERGGICMPKDFPQKLYEEIHSHCQPRMTPEPPNGERWNEYMAAWNAVAYRFRAVADHDEAFVLALFPDTHENRYKQEKELFGFFVSGLSVLESFSYGLYFLASLVASQHFPIQKRQEITLKVTGQCFDRAFPKKPITLCLHSLLNEVTYLEWKRIRNTLAHRCAPGRNIPFGGSSSQDDIWKLENIPLNRNITATRRRWLAVVLSNLLDEACFFVKGNI
jgi:hypothetical protein